MAIRALLSSLSVTERTRLISGLDVHAGKDEQDAAEEILDKLVRLRGVQKNPPKRRHGPKPAKSTNSTEETLRFHFNEIRKLLEYRRRASATSETKSKPAAEYKSLSDLEILQFSLRIFEIFHAACHDELYLTRQERRTLAHSCLQASKSQNEWLSQLSCATGPFAPSAIPSPQELCMWLEATSETCLMSRADQPWTEFIDRCYRDFAPEPCKGVDERDECERRYYAKINEEFKRHTSLPSVEEIKEKIASRMKIEANSPKEISDTQRAIRILNHDLASRRLYDESVLRPQTLLFCCEKFREIKTLLARCQSIRITDDIEYLYEALHWTSINTPVGTLPAEASKVEGIFLAALDRQGLNPFRPLSLEELAGPSH